VERNHGGLLTSIRETGKLADEGLTTLKDAVTEFKKGFETSDGRLLGEDEPVEPIKEEAVVQETVTRVKKD
jgi:F-type H+/Na+-transporting ATPase subunit alpha